MTNDADIVARTAWGEDRSGGIEGMHDVISVIRNRALNPRWWGKNFAEVCVKPWQFSCWNENDPNRSKILAVTLDDPLFAAATSLAAEAINGTLGDRTGGADSYYAIGTTMPFWAKTLEPCYSNQHHWFFRTV